MLICCIIFSGEEENLDSLFKPVVLGNNTIESLPPGIDALLFDTDHLRDILKSGNYQVNKDEVENDLDYFLTDVFLESTKVPDGVVRDISRDESLPKSR